MMLVIRRESFDRSNEESGDLDLLVTLVRLDRRARIRKPVSRVVIFLFVKNS